MNIFRPKFCLINFLNSNLVRSLRGVPQRNLLNLQSSNSLFTNRSLIQFIFKNLQIKQSLSVENVLLNRNKNIIRKSKLIWCYCCCCFSTKPNPVTDSHKSSFRAKQSNKFHFKDNINKSFSNDEKNNQLAKEQRYTNKVYTLPNVLCMLRISVTPLIGYLIVASNYEYALTLCAISSVTDFLDGWIARTFNSETKLGAVLDPLADKLLVATLTFTLTYVHMIPLWLTGLILTRDSLILLGGFYLRFCSLSSPITWNKFFDSSTFKSDRFKPTLISKVNTGFQLSLVLVTLASPIFNSFFLDHHYLLTSLQLATGVTTLWSGLNYLTRLR